MKIAHVVEAIGVGGVTSVLTDLVREQVAVGHEVSVVSIRESDWTSRIEDLGVPVHAGLHGVLPIVRADVVHAHQRRAGLLSVAFGRGRSTVEHVHNPVDGMRGLSFRGSAAVVAVSTSVAEHVASVFKLSADKLQVIENGVPRLAKIGRVSSGRRPIRVVVPARLSAQKNPLYLVDILRHVPQSCSLEIEWIGGGSLEEEFRASLCRAGQSHRVTVLPFADRKIVVERIAEADFVLLVSRFEGLPLGAIESMSVGTPVLMTPSCSLAREIEAASAGYVLPFDDPRGAAEVLLTAFAANRGVLRAAALANFENRYSMTRVMSQWDALYATVAGR